MKNWLGVFAICVGMGGVSVTRPLCRVGLAKPICHPVEVLRMWELLELRVWMQLRVMHVGPLEIVGETHGIMRETALTKLKMVDCSPLNIVRAWVVMNAPIG